MEKNLLWTSAKTNALDAPHKHVNEHVNIFLKKLFLHSALTQT